MGSDRCRSPGMRPPEPLGAQHQREGFDCGNAALNRWLQQRARVADALRRSLAAWRLRSTARSGFAPRRSMPRP
jgi:hypothetical protein